MSVWKELGGQQLKKTSFFKAGAWSFCQVDKVFNISDGLPDEYAFELAKPEANKRAADMPASQWCSILRNSLAHGGVAYLNKDGRYAYEAPVSMYLFVSGRYRTEDDQEKLVGLNLLRIKETDYRDFLRSWVQWLQSSAIAAVLDAA